MAHRLVLVAPFGDQLPHALRPSRRGGGPRRRRLDQPPQRDLGVAEDRHGVGIVPAQLLRIDVELDDLRSEARKHPVVGDLAARVTADEEDQVRFGERAIGAVA